MSTLARLIAGRIVNKAGMDKAEQERRAEDESFWTQLRAQAAELEAKDAVIRENMNAEDVTRETIRRLARGDIAGNGGAK